MLMITAQSVYARRENTFLTDVSMTSINTRESSNTYLATIEPR